MSLDIKKTKKSFKNILLSVAFMSMVVLFATTGAAAGYHPNDDLDNDIEWVGSGSTTVQWGKVVEIEVDGQCYLIKAIDFGANDDVAAISIAGRDGGEVKSEVLFLGQGDTNWLQYDHEVKVELTGISRDSYETPSASLKYYRRGVPELEADISASSETFDGISVSSDQYAPQKEKTITVDVKNTGDAWVECIELVVDIGGLELVERNDLRFSDQVLSKNLGYLDAGETTSVNFTAAAPEWDGVTSPYDIKYEINASVSGADIKGGMYDADASKTLSCTDPKLKMVSDLCSDELYMSPWYDLSYSNVYDDKYSVVNYGVYNKGLYSVRNVSMNIPEMPEGLFIAETYGADSPNFISEDDPYTIGYKLFPVRPGTYKIGKATVSMDFYGKDFSWDAGGFTIKVHGPHVILGKSLKNEGDGKYRALLKLHNGGDRAAWVNLTDSVPKVANYVDGSFEQSIEGSDLPLNEWEFDVNENNDSHLMSLEGIFLPPSESLTVSYLLKPVSLDELDLPYSEAEFRDANGYSGSVLSSYFSSGVEVQQTWDPSTGEWVPESSGQTQTSRQSEQPSDDAQDNSSSDDLSSDLSDPEYLKDSSSSDEPEDQNEQVEQVEEVFDSTQGKMHNFIAQLLDFLGSVFDAMGRSAIVIVEKYLYMIVALIAVLAFLITYVLLKR